MAIHANKHTRDLWDILHIRAKVHHVVNPFRMIRILLAYISRPYFSLKILEFFFSNYTIDFLG